MDKIRGTPFKSNSIEMIRKTYEQYTFPPEPSILEGSRQDPNNPEHTQWKHERRKCFKGS